MAAAPPAQLPQLPQLAPLQMPPPAQQAAGGVPLTPTFRQTARVYSAVIDDVCANVARKLSQLGYDSYALDDLKQKWKLYMSQSGALHPGALEEAGFPAASTVELPSDLPESFDDLTPAAAAGAPSASAAPAGPAQPLQLPSLSAGGFGLALAAGRPSEYMAGEEQAGQRPRGVAQFDGEDDDESDAGEDLDGIDVGDGDEPEEALTASSSYIFCLYDKVSRVKNKRKVVLTSGVMHLSGYDYLFKRATGNFTW
eukprot:m51a1_g7849 putative transcription factor iia alpha beta subunit (254) ;mRNA; f:222508-223561